MSGEQRGILESWGRGGLAGWPVGGERLGVLESRGPGGLAVWPVGGERLGVLEFRGPGGLAVWPVGGERLGVLEVRVRVVWREVVGLEGIEVKRVCVVFKEFPGSRVVVVVGVIG